MTKGKAIHLYLSACDVYRAMFDFICVLLFLLKRTYYIPVRAYDKSCVTIIQHANTTYFITSTQIELHYKTKRDRDDEYSSLGKGSEQMI